MLTDPQDKARLEALSQRIEALKEAENPGPKVEDHHSQAHLAWRMVTELVTGLLIGFGIGYGLDAMFGTMPVFMVLFILLGFAAGIKVMLRTAKEAQAQSDALTQESAAEAADGEGR